MSSSNDIVLSLIAGGISFVVILLAEILVWGKTGKEALENPVTSVIPIVITIIVALLFQQNSPDNGGTKRIQTDDYSGVELGPAIENASDSEYAEFVNKVRAYDASIVVPKESNMLDNPISLEVKGANPNSKSGGMYLCRSPGEDSIKVAKSHTYVTVLAVRGDLQEKNGYVFVETETGDYGWISLKATGGKDAFYW